MQTFFVLPFVAAGAELEVVADRGGGDLAEFAALDAGHVAQEHDTWR